MQKLKQAFDGFQRRVALLMMRVGGNFLITFDFF
jgi:hypothetical protein